MGKEYVWYACYGSNLRTERFMAYIKGTNIPGTSVKEVGCRDKSEPIKIEKYILPYQMYFAGGSKRWNKQGVAFIGDKPDQDCITYGKRYLITREQFFDIVCQENNISLDEIDNIGAPIFSEIGSYVLFPKKAYGRVMCVAIEEGIPILTFTTVKETLETAVAPSIEYLNMIAKGIHETYNISKSEIVDYFSELSGVKGNYSKDILLNEII